MNEIELDRQDQNIAASKTLADFVRRGNEVLGSDCLPWPHLIIRRRRTLPIRQASHADVSTMAALVLGEVKHNVEYQNKHVVFTYYGFANNYAQDGVLTANLNNLALSLDDHCPYPNYFYVAKRPALPALL